MRILRDSKRLETNRGRPRPTPLPALLVVVLAGLGGCGEKEPENAEFERLKKRVKAAFAVEDAALRHQRIGELVTELEGRAEKEPLARQLVIETLPHLLKAAEDAGDRVRIAQLRKQRERWLRRNFEQYPDHLESRAALAVELAEMGSGDKAWALVEGGIPRASKSVADAATLLNAANRVLANVRARGGEDSALRRRRQEKMLELSEAAVRLAEAEGVAHEAKCEAWANHATLLFSLARFAESRRAVARLAELDPGGEATVTLERWLRETPDTRPGR